VALHRDRRRTVSVGLPSDVSVGLERGLELSVPRLSQRQTLVALAWDASIAGESTVRTLRGLDTWRRTERRTLGQRLSPPKSVQ
jgi:hypothetical protein